MSQERSWLRLVADALLTAALWTYFIWGFLLFFSPLYLLSWLLARDRQIALQRLNHVFFKSFLSLLQILVPRLHIDIDARIKRFSSCVVVSNHRSFLDPVLLVATFKKQTTIAKSDLFYIPVFGWIIKASGYIPSERTEKLASLVVERIQDMQGYLAKGGVLFVFPEGTRNTDQELASFYKGAFKIARQCRAPVEVVYISNTDQVFAPGRILFNSRPEKNIQVRWVGSIHQDEGGTSVEELVRQARQMMQTGLQSRPET
ncbi:MAG: lysophospholipid acyltransferase family protein [Desulfohalobiaceae bacterium]